MDFVKGLLFDLDGTLFNSKKSTVESVYQTAYQFKPGKFTYAEVEARFGEPWEIFAKELEYDDINAIIETYMKFANVLYDKRVEPFPGVKEHLLNLRKEGYKIALVTNNQRSLAMRALKIWELDCLFDCIVTNDDVAFAKPHPEPVEKAIKELHLDKREVLMVGDTIYDAKAAHAAGIKCAIVDWYNRYPLSQWKPDFFFSELTELIEEVKYYKKREAV